MTKQHRIIDLENLTDEFAICKGKKKCSVCHLGDKMPTKGQILTQIAKEEANSKVNLTKTKRASI
jgi:hypothetical protein